MGSGELICFIRFATGSYTNKGLDAPSSNNADKLRKLEELFDGYGEVSMV